MASLPYVTATGNVERALKAIKAAATPERISQDFVKTILQIKGGSGDQMTSYLKKIGFANSDGTPSEIYTKFRNPSTSGAAAAEALRKGYAPLYARNEFMHRLSDDELRGLIIEETGQGEDSSVVGLVFSAIKSLLKFANFDKKANAADSGSTNEISTLHTPPQTPPPEFKGIGVNLAYTINLNLPATTDISVFNAIFKALKDNLLKDVQ